MPLMAIEKEPDKQPSVWWAVAGLAVMIGLGLVGLAAIGWGIYYIVDIVCVSVDPSDASAVCRDIH